MTSTATPPSDHESPELLDLFTTYTASADSIGAHLARAAGRATSDAPLLVATSTDLALYPGGGRAPSTLGFRMSTRGFKELAAVSHLGPALATLVALKQADPHGVWRADAERLLAASEAARRANSTTLWREVIAVEAYRGREERIARMIDYALAVTSRYLRRALADPDHLDHATLRAEFLDDGDRDDLPVSFSRIMIATFFLVGMDISHRLIGWLDDQDPDWSRTMVLVAGKQGRPTAGVTWRTNSVAGMVLAASRGALPVDRLYIAPHAPLFTTTDPGEVAALEPAYRALWAGTRAVVELGSEMFPAFPAFSPDAGGPATADAGTRAIGEMPAITGPDDWFAMVTRLRMVLEDPRQLLSGAVSDYAATALAAAGNEPAALVVPGLDGEPYPAAPQGAVR